MTLRPAPTVLPSSRFARVYGGPSRPEPIPLLPLPVIHRGRQARRRPSLLRRALGFLAELVVFAAGVLTIIAVIAVASLR